MIDTIGLELRDLKKHEGVVNILRLTKGGYKKYDGRGVSLNHEILMPEVSRRAKEKFMYKVKETASSHYKLIITVDWFDDVIKFNFSVPKYFYGHNIAQAVQSPCDKDFNFTYHSFDEIKDLGYQRMMRYLYTFFDSEFPTIKIDYTDLKLKRLDLCYNQIFQTSNDALEYLELQKSVKKKFLREQQGCQTFETSIFYWNKNYSVKIYHKGTEYKKNDKNEHIRINTIKKANIFDVEYLQQISDRILRYEITIRPSYMSYLYNNYLFRSNSKQFKTWKKIYNQVKNINLRFDKKKFFETVDKNKEIALLIPDLKKKFDSRTDLNFIDLMQLHYLKRVNQSASINNQVELIKRFYRDFDVLIHKRRTFNIKLNHKQKIEEIADNQDNGNKFNTFEDVEFSQKLFCLMGDKLKEFISDMRIDSKQPISHYLDKIDLHNEKMKRAKEATKNSPSYAKNKYKEFDKPKLAMILICLQNNSLETIKNLTGICESTFYKYKSDLSKIGYKKNTLDNLHIQVPEIDFKNYYLEISMNERKFFSKSLQNLLSEPKNSY